MFEYVENMSNIWRVLIIWLGSLLFSIFRWFLLISTLEFEHIPDNSQHIRHYGHVEKLLNEQKNTFRKPRIVGNMFLKRFKENKKHHRYFLIFVDFHPWIWACSWQFSTYPTPRSFFSEDSANISLSKLSPEMPLCCWNNHLKMPILSYIC